MAPRYPCKALTDSCEPSAQLSIAGPTALQQRGTGLRRKHLADRVTGHTPYVETDASDRTAGSEASCAAHRRSDCRARRLPRRHRAPVRRQVNGEHSLGPAGASDPPHSRLGGMQYPTDDGGDGAGGERLDHIRVVERAGTRRAQGGRASHGQAWPHAIPAALYELGHPGSGAAASASPVNWNKPTSRHERDERLTLLLHRSADLRRHGLVSPRRLSPGCDGRSRLTQLARCDGGAGRRSG